MRINPSELSIVNEPMPKKRVVRSKFEDTCLR